MLRSKLSTKFTKSRSSRNLENTNSGETNGLPSSKELNEIL